MTRAIPGIVIWSLINTGMVASWKKVNQRWSLVLWRRLRMSTAFSGVSHRVAPVARDDDGDQQLVAYLLTRDGTEIETAAVRDLVRLAAPDRRSAG